MGIGNSCAVEVYDPADNMVKRISNTNERLDMLSDIMVAMKL